METTKRWYMSRAIWGIVLAAIISVAATLGITPAAQLPDWLVLLLDVLALAVAALGRLVATKRLV